MTNAILFGLALSIWPVQGPPSSPDTVAIRSGGLALRGLYWQPSGRGPWPAVLFNHGSGPAQDSRNAMLLGRTFAERGYAFLYLYRRGAGLSQDQGRNSQDLMTEAFQARGQQGRNEVQLQALDDELQDVAAGLAFLRARSEIDAQRVAVAGHSFGGQLALLMAERDSTLRAAIVFAAASASWDGSLDLRDRLLIAAGRSDVPVFFVYAANDHSTAPGSALSARMTSAGKFSQLQIYPAIGATAGHGHDFVHRGVSVWAKDVFAFLSTRTRK